MRPKETTPKVPLLSAVEIDEREIATILYALRNLQNLYGSPKPNNQDFHEWPSLGVNEIDALCKRLNGNS